MLINPVSLNLFRSGFVAVHNFIYWYRLDSNLYEFEETGLIKMDPYSVWSRSLLAEYLCFSSGKVIDFFWSLSIFFILMYFLISYGCINAGTLCFRDDSSWSHRPFRTGKHRIGTFRHPHQRNILKLIGCPSSIVSWIFFILKDDNFFLNFFQQSYQCVTGRWEDWFRLNLIWQLDLMGFRAKRANKILIYNT